MLADSMQSLQRSVARLSWAQLPGSGGSAGAGISIKFDAEVSRLQAARSNVGNALCPDSGWLPQTSRRIPGSHERVIDFGAECHKTPSDRLPTIPSLVN